MLYKALKFLCQFYWQCKIITIPYTFIIFSALHVAAKWGGDIASLYVKLTTLGTCILALAYIVIVDPKGHFPKTTWRTRVKKLFTFKY